MPSYYLNQSWNIVNWILRNKLLWNCDWNSNIFIQGSAFENIVCEMAAISLSLDQLSQTLDGGDVSYQLSLEVVAQLSKHGQNLCHITKPDHHIAISFKLIVILIWQNDIYCFLIGLAVKPIIKLIITCSQGNVLRNKHTLDIPWVCDWRSSVTIRLKLDEMKKKRKEKRWDEPRNQASFSVDFVEKSIYFTNLGAIKEIQ